MELGPPWQVRSGFTFGDREDHELNLLSLRDLVDGCDIPVAPHGLDQTADTQFPVPSDRLSLGP